MPLILWKDFKTLELLTSYTKITQLITFSNLSFGDTTAHAEVSHVHCRSYLGLPVSYVANNDAGDINAKHSNFKTIFRDKIKPPQLVLHYCGYPLSSNLMPCWSIAKQCTTEYAIRPATSMGDLSWRRNPDFTVFTVIHSSLWTSNPFRGTMQPL